MTFSSVAGTDIVSNEEAAYQYWLRTVSACLAAEQGLGSKVVMRIRHADLVASPESVLRRCFDFVGARYCSSSLVTLGSRINASKGAIEYKLGSGSPLLETVRQATDLSNALSSGDQLPSHPPSTRLELESAFWAHVDFVSALDSDRSALIRALKDSEIELLDRTDWSQRQDQELRVARKQIEHLNRIIEERAAWSQQQDAELAVARKQIGELGRALEERTERTHS